MVSGDRISFYAETLPSRRSPSVAAVNKLFGLARNGSRVPILQDVSVPHGGIVLVTGASGSGKSSLLKILRNERVGVVVAAPPDDPEIPLIDLFGDDFAAAISWLGRFGLGEPRVMTTPYGVLSDGQKSRAKLALAAWPRPKCIVADEFLSMLDRTTARLVAYNFQKVCRAEGIDAILATAHEDLEEALAPDHMLRLDLGAQAATTQPARGQLPVVRDLAAITYCTGSSDDFQALSRFHYNEHLASEEPLSELDWRHVVTEVRAARYRGKVVGVAVFSRPFPELMERMPFFRLVNKRLSIVLRIIIHPAFRGVGLSKALMRIDTGPDVRALVPCSALGIHIPFFLGAGFERVEHPRSLRYPEHAELEGLLSGCSEEDLDCLNHYSDAQRYYAGLSREDRAVLRPLVTAICTRMNVDYARFHAKVADIDLGTDECAALEDIYHGLAERVPEDSFGTMLSEALFFPVAGFVKRL